VTGVKVSSDTPGRGSVSRNNSQTGADTCPSPRAGNPKLVSQNSITHNRIQRQRSLKNNNDDAIKKSRPHPSSYQLSQDLHDKQVEMLERKYGGSIRSRRAARTIQRAFRHYCMNKNFQKLRNSYGERRLSKRLSELGRSNTVWSERLSTDQTGTADDNGNINHSPNEETDAFGRNIRSMVADFESNSRSSDHLPYQHTSNDTGARPDKSYRGLGGSGYIHRVDSKRKGDRNPMFDRFHGKENIQANVNHNSFSSPSFNVDGMYNRGSKSKSASVSSQESSASGGSYHGSETDIGRGQYDHNSEGVGDYLWAPTVKSTVIDNNSLVFEAHLEGKDSEVLADSFHSDDCGGHDISGFPALAKRSSSSSLRSGKMDYVNDVARNSSSPGGSFDGFRTISVEPSDYMSGGGDSPEIKIDPVFSGENSPAYTKEELASAQMKFYMTNWQAAAGSRESNTIAQLPDVVTLPPVRSTDTSPIWKRKGDGPTVSSQGQPAAVVDKKGEAKRMSNISEISEADSIDGVNSSCISSENVSTENISMGSEHSLSYQCRLRMSITPDSQTLPRSNDKARKRLYRIGLNLFNKKPEKGLNFLLDHQFLDASPKSVARFFITRKGLSKQMIGEFLGNLQNPFNQEVLQYFCDEIDLSGVQVDMALRKFQCYFRMPGEAQKIERLMEAFSERYCDGNPDQVKNFKSQDTIFLLAFAIIMLNTDLHNPSVKPERKMKLEEFLKNMRGIDDGEDIDRDLLTGIYERVKAQEFKAGVDQVTQVMKVEQTIVGKKPMLCLPHRRLVCYCRLYEVHDPNKKEKIGLHQREVFLFNDLLLITKIFSKKKTGITYSFRASLPLCGMQVYLFETSHYQCGIQLSNNIDGKALITFNARNDHDRKKFVEDLKESILETNGMEQMRIEEEMTRHRTTHNTLDKRYACDDSRVLASCDEKR
jgi:IQ motif/SEC7 domain-containing protein